MAYKVIPLTTVPYSEQTFKLTLGEKNLNIKLNLQYHDLVGDWTAKITDNTTGEVLVDTMPLVCGVDLLGQFPHMGIGHAWVIPTEDTTLEMPDNETLGTKFVLVWGDDS